MKRALELALWLAALVLVSLSVFLSHVAETRAGAFYYTATVTLKRDHKKGDKVECTAEAPGRWGMGDGFDAKHLVCTEDEPK